MIVDKVYESLVDIKAAEMYQNVDSIIMNKLQLYFEGRCKAKCLILKIKKIINRSAVRLEKSLLDGTGSVSVKFLASAIVYNEGDILADCDILKADKHRQIIAMYDDNTTIVINGNMVPPSLTTALKRNAKIAITVLSASYLKDKSMITVFAAPYSYPDRTMIYKIGPGSTKLSAEEIVLLDKLRTEWASAVNTFEAHKEEAIPVIDGFWPYDDSSASIKKQVTAACDASKWYETAFSGDASETYSIITRPPFIEKTSGTIIELSDETTMRQFIAATAHLAPATIVTDTAFNIYSTLLTEHMQYVQMLTDMVGKDEDHYAKYVRTWEKIVKKPTTNKPSADVTDSESDTGASTKKKSKK